MKKFLIGFAIFLVVFIVLPIGFVFIFLFDTGKMPVEYNDSFNKEEWSKALVVDSLDYAPTDQVARFEVSEADINNFIHSAIKDNAQFNQYVTQLAVDAEIFDLLAAEARLQPPADHGDRGGDGPVVADRLLDPQRGLDVLRIGHAVGDDRALERDDGFSLRQRGGDFGQNIKILVHGVLLLIRISQNKGYGCSPYPLFGFFRALTSRG